MPLNILLADDSVPAQNMGKKILMDAGYHVLTVSNGLEALRKIADSIPDIAILDIFMPGYTGLELCERLRASAATATLPVILTVGKLEPYRPQDGEQVHSNAVIVKPFAAAELISAVRSLIGAPDADADSNPELGVDRHAADANADPLQENPFAEADSPLDIGHSAEQEEVADEPLFSLGLSATRHDESPLADGEPIAHSAEPFPSDVELDGTNSLVFDPDAKHTSFSASAIDFLPVASHSPAESGASAFTEFNLEPEPSHYSAAAEEELSTAAGASLASTAVAEADLDASQAPVLTADLMVAPEEAASAAGDAAELEALDVSFLDVPAHDPQLEVDEDSAVPPEEEESRRLAFEELFNSTQPFPEESSPIESAGSSIAVLPNMADLSRDHPFDVASDNQIESLIDHNRSEFTAPESDLYLMQEADQSSVVGAIPERDPLLEDALEASWSVPASAQAEESMAPTADELYSAQAEEPIELTAGPLDAVAVETQDVAVEAHVTEPEILAPAYPAEVGETSSEAVAEQVVTDEAITEQAVTDEAQFVPEVLETVSEAPIEQPQFVSEVLLAEAAEPMPEQVMHLGPETEPSAAAPESAELKPETHMAQCEPSPEASLQSIEAERIREAVDKVFDRFKRLLVAAIVRELAHHD